MAGLDDQVGEVVELARGWSRYDGIKFHQLG